MTVSHHDAFATRRAMQRIMRWDAAVYRDGPKRDSLVLIIALKNACGDYMEPCPTDWSAVVAESERRVLAAARRMFLTDTGRRWGKRATQIAQIQFAIDDGRQVLLAVVDIKRELKRLPTELRAARLTPGGGCILITHDPKQVMP